MNSAFVKLILMSINAIDLSENEKEKRQKKTWNLISLKIEKPIYPKASEDLLNFLLKQRDANANVTICLRCSTMFEKDAAKAGKEHKEAKIEKEKKKLE